MRKNLLPLTLLCTTALFGTASAVFAQSPTPAPAPNNSQLNLQFLADVLRSATALHAAVQSMNLDKTFNQDAGTSAARTAAILGAGAGLGAAIGEMSHSQKGLMIGAAAGGAGALLIDQILQHKNATASAAPDSGNDIPAPGFRER